MGKVEEVLAVAANSEVQVVDMADLVEGEKAVMMAAVMVVVTAVAAVMVAAVMSRVC